MVTAVKSDYQIRLHTFPNCYWKGTNPKRALQLFYTTFDYARESKRSVVVVLYIVIEFSTSSHDVGADPICRVINPIGGGYDPRAENNALRKMYTC